MGSPRSPEKSRNRVIFLLNIRSRKFSEISKFLVQISPIFLGNIVVLPKFWPKIHLSFMFKNSKSPTYFFILFLNQIIINWYIFLGCFRNILPVPSTLCHSMVHSSYSPLQKIQDSAPNEILINAIVLFLLFIKISTF